MHWIAYGQKSDTEERLGCDNVWLRLHMRVGSIPTYRLRCRERRDSPKERSRVPTYVRVKVPFSCRVRVPADSIISEEKLRVGSLFSGIGGIELGFEAEGFETIWFVECDLYAQSILRKHWPTAVIYDDITTLDFATVPKVDILTGGFPCQDISNAGKRAGITGSRSSLWKYYANAIRILRPKFALIENVAALSKRGLDVVLADLAEIGYDAEWYNLSASAVGAMHRRERLFIIAYPNSFRCKRESFSEITKGCDTDTINIVEQKNNDVSYSEGSGLEIAGIAGFSSANESQRSVTLQNMCGIWGKTEPSVCRVVDGVPNWAHRIKCLGNAVVPQCAQIFAQAIKKKVNGE